MTFDDFEEMLLKIFLAFGILKVSLLFFKFRVSPLISESNSLMIRLFIGCLLTVLRR